MEERRTLSPGTIVYSADGEKIGTIQSSDQSFFVMEPGMLPADAQIPVSTIAMSRDGEVHLSVTRAEAREQRWTKEPAVRDVPGAGLEPGSEYTAVQGEDSLEEDPMPTPGDEPASGETDRRPAASGSLERPSGISGPIDDGNA